MPSPTFDQSEVVLGVALGCFQVKDSVFTPMSAVHCKRTATGVPAVSGTRAISSSGSQP
jgi:hypothetical protein